MEKTLVIPENIAEVASRFSRFYSSLGRWEWSIAKISIKIGNTAVHQGDFVFGDTDGVVVVPKDMTMDVLVGAEGKEVAELILEKR